MAVTVTNAHEQRRADESKLERIVARVIAAEGATAKQVDVDHKMLLSLNRRYLDHDYITDVLTFDLSDGSDPTQVEGEVYVDLDTAAERHAEFGASYDEEVMRYVIHGILHLLGYDDATTSGKERMHALEDAYLDAAR